VGEKKARAGRPWVDGEAALAAQFADALAIDDVEGETEFALDRDHDSVRVRAFALEALEQLKANFAVVSESALVLGDEKSIIVRSVRQRFWVLAKLMRSGEFEKLYTQWLVQFPVVL
jgi:hypothetical protein